MAQKRVRKVKRKSLENEINVYSLDGKIQKKISLPEIFNEEFRPDLIRKAVNAARANRRQPYGPNPMAGMRHAVSTVGKGRGMSRVQRLADGRTGAESPPNVGGRRAHPPKPEKNWEKKINKQERKKARFSALHASKEHEMVKLRGHRFSDKLTLPIVLENKIEDVATTKEIIEMLENVGLWDDILRAKESKHIRAGKGKMRSRKYKKAKSLLIVASKLDSIEKGFRNLPGVDVTTPQNLNTELLAPGGDPGRLVIFSESAIDQLREW
jgi:large subunit ribosomal protein L4e